jgi:hypothetical protein
VLVGNETFVGIFPVQIFPTPAIDGVNVDSERTTGSAAFAGEQNDNELKIRLATIKLLIFIVKQ